MVDFVLNYEDILFLRKGNDCFYVRYKGGNKTEFCIPFSSLLEWDKNLEFYNHCKELEKVQDMELWPEKTSYYKFIRLNDGTDEKVYFNKYTFECINTYLFYFSYRNFYFVRARNFS